MDTHILILGEDDSGISYKPDISAYLRQINEVNEVDESHEQGIDVRILTTTQSSEALDTSEVNPNYVSMNTPSREEIKAQLATVEAKIGESEAKVDARLANFDTSVKTGFAELRAEFAELRTEIANGRTDVMKQSSDNLKWLIGAVAGMLSIAVAVIGVMINFNKSSAAPSTPTAQPTSIVVYTQPAPPAATPSAQPPAAQK